MNYFGQRSVVGCGSRVESGGRWVLTDRTVSVDRAISLPPGTPVVLDLMFRPLGQPGHAAGMTGLAATVVNKKSFRLDVDPKGERVPCPV